MLQPHLPLLLIHDSERGSAEYADDPRRLTRACVRIIRTRPRPPSAPRAKAKSHHIRHGFLPNDAMARLGQALITLRCFACLPVNTTRMLAVVLSVCALLWCSLLTYASQTEGKQSSCCPTSYVAAESNRQEGGRLYKRGI